MVTQPFLNSPGEAKLLHHRSGLRSFGNSPQHTFYASSGSGFSLNNLFLLFFQSKHVISMATRGFQLDSVVLLAMAWPGRQCQNETECVVVCYVNCHGLHLTELNSPSLSRCKVSPLPPAAFFGHTCQSH